MWDKFYFFTYNPQTFAFIDKLMRFYCHWYHPEVGVFYFCFISSVISSQGRFGIDTKNDLSLKMYQFGTMISSFVYYFSHHLLTGTRAMSPACRDFLCKITILLGGELFCHCCHNFLGSFFQPVRRQNRTTFWHAAHEEKTQPLRPSHITFFRVSFFLSLSFAPTRASDLVNESLLV